MSEIETTAEGKEKKARKARKAVRRWAAGFCAVMTAASLGIAAGLLFAPASGKETRETLKQHAEKTVRTVKKEIRKKCR